ncbi:DUF2381 family protein [Corallococcus sp. bb12-1]|nr:DUF2381 family protein [Corallococcus sp. bb12-1]
MGCRSGCRKRKRPVTVASTPAEPLPVVDVAGDTPTVFLFSSPTECGGDGRLFDAERVLLEPRVVESSLLLERQRRPHPLAVWSAAVR